jgi:hypothetical protein
MKAATAAITITTTTIAPAISKVPEDDDVVLDEIDDGGADEVDIMALLEATLEEELEVVAELDDELELVLLETPEGRTRYKAWA